MTHCLIVLYNCLKFHFNSFKCCKVTERTRNSTANDQRKMTSCSLAMARSVGILAMSPPYCFIIVF